MMHGQKNIKLMYYKRTSFVCSITFYSTSHDVIITTLIHKFNENSEILTFHNLT